MLLFAHESLSWLLLSFVLLDYLECNKSKIDQIHIRYLINNLTIDRLNDKTSYEEKTSYT